MDSDLEKFEKVKTDRKIFYENIGKVYCPYLKTDVYFNSEGFEHLLNKSWNRGRSIIEQYTRLRLLPKVVEVVKSAQTLQEYEEKNIFVRQNINSRWEKRLKKVYYYAFIAFLKEHDLRLKVVVKQISGGQPFFWSVYPQWKISKDTQGNKKKVFYSGNLEED